MRLVSNLVSEKKAERAYGDFSDEELIKFCIEKRDTVAFDSLMLRYQDSVFRLCYRLLGNYEDALELAQDVFLTCFRKLHTFAGRAKFSTWLYRLVINHSKNFLKRSRRSASAHSISINQQLNDEGKSPVQVADDKPGPREDVASKQLQELLQQRMQLLTPEHRQVLILRYAEELSYEEIAQIIGAPIGTVKSRINRAREELRRFLNDVGEK